MGTNKEASALKTMKKWYLLLIIAPGILFIVWFYNTSHQTSLPGNIDLPEIYLEGGDKSKLDGVNIQAGESNKAITSTVIELPYNKVRADLGLTFLAIPVYLSRPGQEVQWQLVDSNSDAYRPLPVEQSAIALLIKKESSIKNSPQHYLLFKVNNKVNNFYLIANIGTKHQAWHFIKSK